jgi:3-oxoacyl-[acyl-carrier-protein] synthase-1
MLENYDQARQRGANILGEILGYGFSSDGANISVPSEDGLYRAMRAAVHESGWNLSEIDFVCAHATATPAGDGKEAVCIDRLFGADVKPAVASLKGLVGHELWMAGAAQVVYCTLMAQYGFTAASANFQTPDEHSAKLKILTQVRNEPPRRVLCNAAGFGGTNSCLAIGY